MTATELLEMANRDASRFAIHGDRAIARLALANEFFRAEEGQRESEWAPVSASIIRSNVKAAYRLSGEVA